MEKFLAMMLLVLCMDIWIYKCTDAELHLETGPPTSIWTMCKSFMVTALSVHFSGIGPRPSAGLLSVACLLFSLACADKKSLPKQWVQSCRCTRSRAEMHIYVPVLKYRKGGLISCLLGNHKFTMMHCQIFSNLNLDQSGNRIWSPHVESTTAPSAFLYFFRINQQRSGCHWQ